MLLELLKAMVLAGVPVGAATYALVWWSLRQGYIGPAGSVREVERGFKQISKQKSAARKERKRQRLAPGQEITPQPLLAGAAQGMSPVHSKWLAFGGGFYGVVGLLTYGVVELKELRDFFLGFESLSALFAQFGLNMLIGLLVEALKNFIVAIAWPAYWLSDIRSDHIWIWFLVAYAAYWAGAKLALRHFVTGQAGPDDGDSTT
jgi:hypothetical protein